MGHYLGLLHTFNNDQCFPQDTPGAHSGCYGNGDLICDTPAEQAILPGFEMNVAPYFSVDLQRIAEHNLRAAAADHQMDRLAAAGLRPGPPATGNR